MEPEPTRVFEDVSADLFTHGHNNYLIYADRLSGWPTVTAWMGKTPTSADIIGALKKSFVDLGIPVRLRSDGGPQFASAETSSFCKKWGVTQALSTPHYSQSNGHAEAAVKAMKALIIKTDCDGKINSDAFSQGVLEWRNTPRAHGLSPAQILFGHPMRSIIPAHHSSFDRKWTEIMDNRDRIVPDQREKTKRRYDERAHPLKPFIVGEKVRVQDPVSKRWDKTGTIISTGPHRDYRIRFPSGRIYWRNRRFIKPDYSADAEALPHSVTINPTPDIIDEHPVPDPPVTSSSSRRRRKQQHEGPLRRSSRTQKKNPRYE